MTTYTYTQAVIDDFSGTTLNASIWDDLGSQSGTVDSSVDDGTLTIPIDTAASGNEVEIDSVGTWNLANGIWAIKRTVTGSPAQTTDDGGSTGGEVYFGLWSSNNESGPYLEIQMYPNMWAVLDGQSGGYIYQSDTTDLGSAWVNGDWWGVGNYDVNGDGNIQVYNSQDGQTWTQVDSGFGLGGVNAEAAGVYLGTKWQSGSKTWSTSYQDASFFTRGTSGGSSGGGSTTPAASKLGSLTDPFSGTSLNTALWNANGLVTESGGQLVLPQSTAYTGISSVTAYDLTSSYAFVHMTPDTVSADDGDDGLAAGDAAFTDGWTIGVTGGSLYVQTASAGTYATVYTTAYDATAHAWLRIREASGTLYFETAPDGLTWTTVYSTTDESLTDVTNVYVNLFAGNTGSADAGTAYFADFNVAPSGGSQVTVPSPPLLGMYETGGSFPTPGPSAWPSGPATNMSAYYMAWGQDWSSYAGAFITECNSNGLVPFVELEPWESGPDWNTVVPFSDITDGTWDSWLEEIGTSVAASGKPCILTFAHEFNVSGQYPWSQGMTGSGPGGGTLTAAEWIAGWQYVRAKVNASAGGCAIWIWACAAYTGGTSVDPTPYWPGASYVDMAGIDAYPSTEYGASLGTFAGQVQPTVTIIRDLGWTDPVFISETNLAQMADGGTDTSVTPAVTFGPGQDIPSFVADMYTAGMSGILEFEDATWGLPQMSSTQWAEYNNAVAQYYGTPSASPAPSALLAVSIV